MNAVKHICINCGKEYNNYKPNSKFCNIECKKDYNNVLYHCDNCGKEIIIHRNKYQKLLNGEIKHKYCSRDCSNQGLKNSVLRTCEFCDKKFSAWVSESNRKFCSSECYELSRKQYKKLNKRVCKCCGKDFATYHKNQKFCSVKCSSKSQQYRTSCVCSNCGTVFERITSEVVGKNNVFCSKKCEVDFRSWNKDDEDILKKYYKTLTINEIVLLLSKEYNDKAICSHAISMGLSESRLWLESEEQIIKEKYENTKIEDLLKLLPNRTEASIRGKAHSFGLKGYYYHIKRYTDGEKTYIQNHYLDKSNEELAAFLNRTPYAIEQYLRSNDLFRPTEIQKTGYKSLQNFMRSRLTVWADNVRKKNNYVCSVTGGRSNIVVHHCRSFNILMEETIGTIDFPIKDNFEDYTDEELNKFVNTFFQIQENYGEYVCVNEDIHKLFHKEYGYGDNNMEQWREFTYKYKQGLYN